MALKNSIGNLAVTVVASLVLIVLGIVYYMVTIFVIKMGAGWAGYTDLQGNMVVLTAGIVTAASMIGSAIQH
ncbi:MAG: hypothetical protein ABIG95_05265 [Candidatus Woesearchaeota archaeon]